MKGGDVRLGGRAVMGACSLSPRDRGMPALGQRGGGNVWSGKGRGLRVHPLASLPVAGPKTRQILGEGACGHYSA